MTKLVTVGDGHDVLGKAFQSFQVLIRNDWEKWRTASIHLLFYEDGAAEHKSSGRQRCKLREPAISVSASLRTFTQRKIAWRRELCCHYTQTGDEAAFSCGAVRTRRVFAVANTKRTILIQVGTSPDKHPADTFIAHLYNLDQVRAFTCFFVSLVMHCVFNGCFRGMHARHPNGTFVSSFVRDSV